MENNYRDMMDAVKAPEGLRMEVMNMSEQERTKKTRPLPVRAALAAACIGALLMTAAIAAEGLGFDFVKIFPDGEKKIRQGTVQGQESEGIQEWEVDYEVDGSGAEYIPLSALSQEIQDKRAQVNQKGVYHQETLAFDTWAEVEEYLGLELADNDLLDLGTHRFPVRYSTNGVPEWGNYLVDIRYPLNGAVGVTVSSQIEWGYNKGCRMAAYIGAGGDPDDPGVTLNFGFNDIATAESQESYLTPNGLETVIVHIVDAPLPREDGGEHRAGHYHAYFTLRGALFEVKTTYAYEVFPEGVEETMRPGVIWESHPPTQKQALATLKEILDAFE